MNRFALCIVCLGFASQVFAQDESFLHNRIVLERMGALGSGGNGVPIGNLPGSPPGILGDVYLNIDYRNAGFMLYDNDKIVTGFPARLDLQRNEFDLLTQGGVKSLRGSMVKSMLWRDSLSDTPQYFVNGKDFKNAEGVPFLGFFQVLSEGEISLFKKSEVIFKPAEQQSKAHAVGPQNNKFIKKSVLYYTTGNTVLEVTGKKNILKIFDSKKAEIDKFIEVNGILFKRENHLTALFDYYNSLVKK